MYWFAPDHTAGAHELVIQDHGIVAGGNRADLPVAAENVHELG